MTSTTRLAAIAVATFCLSLAALPTYAADDEQKAILVTGASTGIGRNLAERLASEGHLVYAGARKQEDIDELNAIDNIVAVRLDVTNQEEIDAAVEFVRSQGHGLWGLVNNAGVAVYGPITQAPHSDLEFVMDVNVMGVARVTKAFTPLILESKGRIATTGSISGILSGASGAGYSMSKHAIEAFADSLAAELAPAGVHVSVIEPGGYKTRMRRTTAQRMLRQMQAAGMEITDEIRAQAKAAEQRELSLQEPDDVSEAFLHALFSDEPKRRYMVVPNANEAEITIKKMIEELVQLNDWHAYSYSRDDLVEMLDEALSRQ